MKIEKIKNRGVLFTLKTAFDWDMNIYLILGNKYNYIIDTGLGALNMAPVIEYINNDTKPVIVINTHYHWDHIWGNNSFKECTIISHKLCREIIEENWKDMLERYGSHRMGEVEMCLPNLVFEKEVYFPDDKIRIIYTPGHSVDSISVIDEDEKVIHVGDNIGDTLEEIVPDIDCEKDIYIDTLLKYRDIDFDTCVSGHNVIVGKDIINKIMQLLNI